MATSIDKITTVLDSLEGIRVEDIRSALKESGKWFLTSG